MKNFINKIFNAPRANLEQKSFNNFFPFLVADSFGGWYDILAFQALLYYRMVAPLNTGISMICDDFSNINPVVFDEKNDEYIEDHPVLDLLDHPFADMTWNEFAKEFSTYYIATGNNYTIVTGDVTKPPLEMYNVHPSTVTITPSVRDGYNESFLVNTAVYSDNYKRREIGGYFRYYNSGYFNDGTANRELWQTATFNPRYMPGYPKYGMSALTPIYFEIEQHLQSSIHNRGLLVNGARLAMAFIKQGELTNDQYERVSSQLRENFKGANNAGKNIILDGDWQAKEYGITNKDMDFLELKKEVALSIYSNLKIPLPLVSNDKATFSNMNDAISRFYDNAVIPLANRVFKELSLLLLPRYKNSENLVITFKQDEITALQDRKIEQITKLGKLEIYTTNELRKLLGLPEVKGGDEIFKPSTNMPISLLAEGIGNDEETAPASNIQSTKQNIIKLLNKQTFSDGTKLSKY